MVYEYMIAAGFIFTLNYAYAWYYATQREAESNESFWDSTYSFLRASFEWHGGHITGDPIISHSPSTARLMGWQLIIEVLKQE